MRTPFARLLASAAVVIVAWDLCARLLVRNPLFLPLPAAVLTAGLQVARSGELWRNMGVSTVEFLAGSLMGVGGGVLLGVLMGANQKLADYVDPWVSAAYTAPLVALTPLLIIWFGIGLWSKAIIICLVVIFPVTIATTAIMTSQLKILVMRNRAHAENLRCVIRSQAPHTRFIQNWW